MSSFQPNQTILNRYRTEKKLGEGTYGKVYLVTDTDPNYNNASFAMKQLIHEEKVSQNIKNYNAQRFKNEYRAGHIIQSPFVVRCFHYYEAENIFTMEYAANKSIQHHLEKIASDLGLFHKMMRNFYSGLFDTHCANIIHRDIKPENILLDKDWLPKIADFGIAEILGERSPDVIYLGENHDYTPGTDPYIAPEMRKGRLKDRKNEPTADIFATGVMLYYILSKGYFPFGEYTNNEKNYQQRAANGTWNDLTHYRTDVPQVWIDVIQHSLHPDPQQRIQSAKTVIDMIDAAIPKKPVLQWFHLGLQVEVGSQIGHIFALAPYVTEANNGLVRFGQYEPTGKNHLVFEDRRNVVSRAHATLEYNRKSQLWYIRDGQYNETLKKWRKSTGGTKLNRQPINEQGIPIKIGDEILLSDMYALRIIQLNQ